MMPHQDLRAVVDLERVGYAHHSAGARLHPEWLIVGWPVHQEIESNLLQEDGRSMESRTSCRKRFSSDSHMWPWRSAFVRPCPINSSPRAFSASTIRGA